MPGRKHQMYAPGQAARFGGRKHPVKGGVGVGVQMATDPDQALGLAGARMIREGLHRARPVYARRRVSAVGRRGSAGASA